MKIHKIKGSIVNISSVRPIVPTVENVHYNFTKGGLKILAETLALEYAEQGIRSGGIAAVTITALGNPTEKQVAEEKEKTLQKIPM